MSNWEIESNNINQNMFLLLMFVIGLVLTIGFRNFESYGFNNEFSGFLLGILVFVSSLGGLILNTKRTIIVNPKTKNIVIKNKNRFKSSDYVVPFSKVTDLYVQSSGDNDGGNISYDVILKLKSNENVPLFSGAFFDGRYNKSDVQDTCNRLRKYIFEL